MVVLACQQNWASLVSKARGSYHSLGAGWCFQVGWVGLRVGPGCNRYHSGGGILLPRRCASAPGGDGAGGGELRNFLPRTALVPHGL